ncbi:MAG: thioredoxin family protein [Patescibacteria group bacterium]
MINKNLWWSLAVLVVGGAVIIFLVNQPKTNQTEINQEAMMQSTDKMIDQDNESMTKDELDQDKMMPEKDVMANPSDNDKMMEPVDKMVGQSDTMASQGAYLDYSSDLAAAEFKKDNKVVLFFYASWCPFCQAADKVFKNQTNDIPSQVTVLKVDYDKEAQLKSRYGVTYQHTFVQIDETGKVLSRWNGGDLDNLKKYLK